MTRHLLALTALLLSCTTGRPLHVRGCSGAELPLVAIASPPHARGVVVFLTGDGGWRALDRKLSETLIVNHFAVTAFLANRYFETRRSIEESACDLQRTIDAVRAGSATREVALIGYSRGAETIAVTLPRLSEATRRSVRLAVLLGPAPDVSLQRGFFGAPKANVPIDPSTLPAGVSMLCFHGEREKETLCNSLSAEVENVAWRGGHHFGGDYRALAERIVRRWEEVR